jgi:adenylyl- and sulfurtransferase ThiI
VPTAIALLSGGLDSATAAALAQEAGLRVIGLSFDYGQRHRRELEAAAATTPSPSTWRPGGDRPSPIPPWPYPAAACKPA